jgi:hypothetical protein
MADFRTKLIMLAGAAAIYAGTAFGQTASLGGGGGINSVPTFVRAEGLTELLPPTSVLINNSTAGTVSVSLTVYLSPALTITSQSKSGTSETTAVSSLGTVNGTVSGSQVLFTGIQIPVGGSTVAISNIRVNASTLVVGSGIPTAVTETIFLQGATGVVTPAVTPAAIVAYAQNGLAAGSVTVPNSTSTVTVPYPISTSNTTCAGASNSSASYSVTFAESFVGAFKTMAGESGGLAANSGTRVSLTFGNVPSAVSVYVPLSVTASTGGNVQLVASATAATAASNLVAGYKSGSSLGLVATSNGTGTAYYEIYITSGSALDNYTIPVYLSNAAGTLPGPVSAMTVTVSLAPSVAAGTAPTTTSAASYPSFVGASSQQSANGSAFTACTTSLLFPFVTNQAGFETGIAIANTGSDLIGLSSKGVPQTSVTGGTGTCLLTFFGSATGNPAAYTTPAGVAPGTVWTGTLTSVTGGTPNTFGGYMIAQCNFLYAHGFSYITYNIGQPSGMAMGYLALELTRNSSNPEALNN